MARRVLVVEDNPLNMKLVRTLLQLAGYEVVEVQTGEEAVHVGRETRPDLVLMDIQLPGIDGLETCRRMRRDPLLAKTPIVALTSYAMPGDEQRALAAGCSGYVTKPIDTQSFCSTIAGFLS
jgi:CheY-like chemotaxis protein